MGESWRGSLPAIITQFQSDESLDPEASDRIASHLIGVGAFGGLELNPLYLDSVPKLVQCIQTVPGADAAGRSATQRLSGDEADVKQRPEQRASV